MRKPKKVAFDEIFVVKHLARNVNRVLDHDPVATYSRVRDAIRKDYAGIEAVTFDGLLNIAYPQFSNNWHRTHVRNLAVIIYFELEPNNPEYSLGLFGIRGRHIDKVMHYVKHWEEYAEKPWQNLRGAAA